MSGLGLLAAASAGLLSFLSPCVLPLIPAYLSLVSGYGLADLRSGEGRFRAFARTLAFAGGFTLVFTALSLLFSGASMLLGGLSRGFTLVAGILVILLGANLIFDFLKVLDLEARFGAGRAARGCLGSFLVGIAFAAGWSPCVGPILASILLFAAREGKALHAAGLLLAYSLGLTLPFLAASLFFDRLTPLMTWFKRRARGIRVASGLLLVALGAVMALGRLALLPSLAIRWGNSLSRAIEESPGAARCMAAGLWIFVAASIPSLSALRGRRAFTPGKIAFISLFLAIALGDLVGLWSTARLVAAWLSFQGT
jgi:cytochrome c-type biogenesis protein